MVANSFSSKEAALNSQQVLSDDPLLYSFAAATPTSLSVSADARSDATAVSVAGTGNPYVDGVLAGIRWTGALTFSFPQLGSQYPNPYSNSEPTTGFSPISLQQAEATRAILLGTTSGASTTVGLYGSLASLTNINVSEVGGIGNGLNGLGDIRLAQSTIPPTAYAFYPNNDAQGTGGDVWFGTTIDYRTPVFGNYSYQTITHELGHSLGLKHSQETGGPSDVAVPADRDDIEFSTMSYRSYIGAPATGYTYEQWGAPQTFMMLDIYALQTMYGANYTTHATNTIYRWDPNTGQMSISDNGGAFVGQGTPGGNRVFMTIWDGNGNDTYDMSNYTNGVSIDLNPGGWSVTSQVQRSNLGNGNFAQGNVYNSILFEDNVQSLIENAIGGSGADTIVGNQGNNRLDGRAGNDTLTGGAATDTFVFSSGYNADTVTDFVHNVDRVDLTGYSAMTSFSQIMSFATQVGADTVFDFGNGDTLTLKGMTKATLTANDFLYNGKLLVTDDFNGDFTSDILWVNGNGVIDWLMKSGLVNGSNVVTATLPNGWAPIRSGDFDGDGTSDVLVRDNGGTVIDWIMKDGKVASSNVLTTTLGTNWKLVGTGDFNADGTSDVAWQDQSGTVIDWIMQNGTVVAGNIVTTGLPANWTAIGTGDFNGDKTSDILVRDTSGTVVDWLMQNGKFQQGNVLTTGLTNNWTMVGTGDVNNDGTADIVWQDNAGTVVNWIMKDGKYVSGNIMTTGLDPAWKVVKVGDFNGDGTADVLLKNGSTVVDWIVQNGKVVESHVLTTTLDGGWFTV